MAKYIVKRILKALLTIWLVYTLIFCLTRMTGDPTYWILGDTATDEAREVLREQLGLNDPLHEQYVDTIVNMFKGDAGNSYYYGLPVLQLFADRIGTSLKLMGMVLFFSFILGVPLGVMSAVRYGTKTDRVITTLTVIGNTMPNFVLGILLIFIFSLSLRILPSGELKTWQSWIMPVTTLTVAQLSQITRQTRGSMLDVLHNDYLDTARAKGVHEIFVIVKHALRNALVPVVTVFGNMVSAMIGGAVVIETVFSLPGIGNLIINGAIHRDFPLVQFGVLIIACVVTFINIMVDVVYTFLDPKLRDNRR